jgi:hypothetical protein
LVSIPILSPLKLPLPISAQTKRIYDFTQALSAGSIVIESIDYGPSTIPENRPQTKAHIFHCKQLGLKVVVLAFWPGGAAIGDSVLREVYGSAFPDIPEYGTSVVFLGYVPGNEVGMQTFGDNTWNAKGTDHYGTAIGTFPLMQACRSAADFDLWAEWTSGDPGITQVIQFVQGRHGGPSGVPVVTGATAVSVPGIMPYYSTGQIIGILNGMAGAGEYEFLLNVAYGYPFAQGPGLDAQSVGHLLIIAFVIIGNIGYAISKYRGGKSS